MKGSDNEMATIEEKVDAAIASLEDGATKITSAVERYNAAKRDTAGASVTTALVALAKAGAESNVAAVEHVQGKLETDADREMLEMLIAEATELANKLSVSLDTLDTGEYVRSAEMLKGVAALLDGERETAAGTAMTHWNTAYTAYKQASGQNVTRQTGTRRGGLSGPNRGPTGGTRGVGKWFEDHGWYFTATCPECGHVVQSASNLGSFSYEMAKHMASHREDKVRPYDGDPMYDAAREAMYAVAADDGAESVTTDDGWIIARAYAENAA